MHNLVTPHVRAPHCQQPPRLHLSLATTAAEVREVQRLRYEVFVETPGLSTLVNPERLDRDAFDPLCDHLIVRDSETLDVVGTYRVLNGAKLGQRGRFYSDNEFDLSRLHHLRGRCVEAGRACIHPDFRGGSVLMLLWSGLVDYMRRSGCDYLIGCASISLADGGQNVSAVMYGLRQRHLAPAEYRVTPHLPFPVTAFQTDCVGAPPPLLKGYLRLGAWLCGEPAWDPDFESADVFLMLPLANLEARYARHYGMEKLANGIASAGAAQWPRHQGSTT